MQERKELEAEFPLTHLRATSFIKDSSSRAAVARTDHECELLLNRAEKAGFAAAGGGAMSDLRESGTA